MERTAVIERLRQEHGGILPASVAPWGERHHRVVYWFDRGVGDFAAYCAECAERTLAGGLVDVVFAAYDSGDAYDHNLPCDCCGIQLASHFDPS